MSNGGQSASSSGSHTAKNRRRWNDSSDRYEADHGATTFSDPYRTVPQVARVLRPGGLFAFNMGSPFRDVCIEPGRDALTESLHIDYFSMHRLEFEDEVSFQLPYGAWIRLFRASGFDVEDLIELEAPPGADTTYGEFVPRDWARRWPAENIWRVRKRSS